MKFTIVRGLTAGGLRRSIGPSYRSRLPTKLPDGEFTLLKFACTRNDVVLSRSVQSALSRVKASAVQIVAIGGCFTSEAVAALQLCRALVLQLSDFQWTDESFKAIRKYRPKRT